MYKVFVMLAASTFLITACNRGKQLPEDSIYNIPELKDISTQILNDSSNASLWIERGDILHEHGDDSLALMDYITGANLDTTKSEYCSRVGNVYYDNKDVTNALVWYKKSLKINPSDKEANLAYARINLIMRNYDQAIQSVNTIIKQDPSYAKAYYLKGLIFDDMGNKDKAMSSYQTVIQIDPSFSDAYLKMGFIYEEKNDSTCLQYFDNAFRADSNVLGLYASAMYYQNHKQYPQAKNKYQDCINVNPQFSHPYYNLGYIYLQQDSLAKSKEYFNLCLGVDKNFADAYYQKGIIDEKQNKPNDAKANFQQAYLIDSLTPNIKKKYLQYQ